MPKPYGLLAEFDTASAVFEACEKVRDKGYTKWDSCTPFPVHNLDKAMGLKPSKLPWVVLVCGLTGASLGFLLQYWVSAVDYPLIYAGKPFFAWQAFIPVTFELGILFSAFGAVFGMLHFNRLPQYYHPLFTCDRFASVTDDKFFIVIEEADPEFDERKTKRLLQKIGATHVEVVEDIR